jgi:hypothetical protein
VTDTAQPDLEPALDYRRVPWSALRPHYANPRNGDVEAIIESIRAHGGIYKPVIVANDMVILAGHHVYYAAGELEIRQIDIVVRPYDSEDPRALRLLAGDNRHSDLGRYDQGLQLDLLQMLQKAEGGLVGSGYGDEDVVALLAVIEAQNATPIEAPDEFPAYDGTLATDYRCPSCGYEWSGPQSGISGRGAHA